MCEISLVSQMSLYSNYYDLKPMTQLACCITNGYLVLLVAGGGGGGVCVHIHHLPYIIFQSR